MLKFEQLYGPGHDSHRWILTKMQNQTLLFVCRLSAVAFQTGGVSSNRPLALVCEYGVTHYDGWANYMPVRPLWALNSLSAQHTHGGMMSVLESGLSFTWNQTKILHYFLLALLQGHSLNVGIKI